MESVSQIFNLTEQQVLKLSTFLDAEYLKHFDDPDRIAKTVKDIRKIKNKDEREATLMVYAIGLHVKKKVKV